jgi:hypothetical protein
VLAVVLGKTMKLKGPVDLKPIEEEDQRPVMYEGEVACTEMMVR